MKLIANNDGVIELRWSWLPYWIGSNLAYRAELERDIRDRMILNAVTTDELDLLHDYAVAALVKKFADVPGAVAVIEAIAAAG